MENHGIPVTVTVANETEPVTTDGTFTERLDGFILEFAIGSDKFRIEHNESVTIVKADGVMSYDIALKNEQTETMLDTPFGKVMFAVKTETREVKKTSGLMRIMLCYLLGNDAVGDMPRSVDITIRFN